MTKQMTMLRVNVGPYCSFGVEALVNPGHPSTWARADEVQDGIEWHMPLVKSIMGRKRVKISVEKCDIASEDRETTTRGQKFARITQYSEAIKKYDDLNEIAKLFGVARNTSRAFIRINFERAEWPSEMRTAKSPAPPKKQRSISLQ